MIPTSDIISISLLVLSAIMFFIIDSLHNKNLKQKKMNPENSVTTTNSNLNATTNTEIYCQWSAPERVKVNIFSDRIEEIYIQRPLPFYGTQYYELKRKVYMIVHSCVDGKWNQSEPIYGNIIPAQDEYYEFD